MNFLHWGGSKAGSLYFGVSTVSSIYSSKVDYVYMQRMPIFLKDGFPPCNRPFSSYLYSIDVEKNINQSIWQTIILWFFALHLALMNTLYTKDLHFTLSSWELNGKIITDFHKYKKMIDILFLPFNSCFNCPLFSRLLDFLGLWLIVRKKM